MEIRYSNHLSFRIKMRGFPEPLPRFAYLHASRKFQDIKAGVEIAVYHTKLFGKKRDIGVVYQRYPQYVLLITIHPLKPNQVENRIRSGRWQPLQ